ncbi:hypothetical protein [Haladaptatus sp. CMAA 1909]|uniref:hypothetical protein n=1 Tax=Haladaptatus sp. CMAA 1909 TaxID=3368986 RepID=UPI0037545F06
MPLFDTFQSELAIVLDETWDGESDADWLAPRLLENDGIRRLLAGVTEDATAVFTSG